MYHFFAPLRSSPGGPVTGEVFGSKTLFKVATDANPNAEKRATLLFYVWAMLRIKLSLWAFMIIGRRLRNLDAGKSVVRAVLGGTGKYMGARGQLASTRNADGSYNHVFTLLKRSG